MLTNNNEIQLLYDKDKFDMVEIGEIVAFKQHYGYMSRGCYIAFGKVVEKLQGHKLKIKNPETNRTVTRNIHHIVSVSELIMYNGEKAAEKIFKLADK